MPWPLSQDYNEAIQNPAFCFADNELRQGKVVTNALGLPMPCSGNFADVYEVVSGQGKWAVKCFTRQIPGLRERYAEISKYLRQVQLPFMVEFTFLEQGIKVRGLWYPILKMQWVEGMPLNAFVKKHLDNPSVLQAICQYWITLADRLDDAKLAHGDLQHGNVLLVRGSKGGIVGVKLVDYDGMCVPSLERLKSGEVGHPSYQHPQRLREGTYGLEMDNFSHLVIYTALRSLMVGGRKLWDRFDNGDNLLFAQKDLQAPRQSAVFKELLALNDPEVRRLVGILAESARLPLNQTPQLQDIISSTTSSKDAAPTRTGPRIQRDKKHGNKRFFAASLIGCLVVLIGIGLFFLWPPAKGTIILEIEPEQADVFLDGKQVGVGNQKKLALDVPKGTHNLRVTKNGFIPYDKQVHVAAGSVQRDEVWLVPDPKRWLMIRRSSPERDKLLREGGGNEQSEKAVTQGLKWVVQQQKADGSWSLEGYDEGIGRKQDKAATAFGLLPLLGAGYTHKEGLYANNVKIGLAYLLKQQLEDGGFVGGHMYVHALVTIAFCEAFGMTHDDWLKKPAQRAIDFIVKAQNDTGGWDYLSRDPVNDTSVGGWQIQALKSGQVAGLKVPKETLVKASKFLDNSAGDSTGSCYGYRAPGYSFALTPVGLLCRLYLGWGRENAGLMKGVEERLKTAPPSLELRQMYYYYYATQVMHQMGGDAWTFWNPKMRDLLIQVQYKGDNGGFTGTRIGSWPPQGWDMEKYGGGRLMFTSLALLTLEVYYRSYPFSPPTIGSITLEIEPDQAEVFLDDRLIIITSPKELCLNAQEGSHELRITRNGFKRFVEQVRVTAGKTQRIKVKLVPVPVVSNNGKLILEIEPTQSELYLDDEKVTAFSSQQMTLDVPPGKHEVKVAKAGFKTHRQQVEVTAGKTERIKVTLIPNDTKIQTMLDKLVSIPDEGLKDPRPRIAVEFQDLKRRFGIFITDERDPINPLKFKRLTYHENGQNNPTCIKVDNHEYLFGQVSAGVWIKDPITRKPMDLVELQPGRRWKSVMEYPEGIRVTQVVQIVMGETTQLLDTCLVLYQIENNANLTRHVGIRVLIDTFIGSNDGVPFAIPGQPDLVDTMREIPQKDIPDFIQALERSDLSNPGTVAHIGLKIGGLEPMLSVLICRWPDIVGSEVRWRWQPSPMNVPPENKDSCVVMYWPELSMNAKEKRLVGYTYGLGRVGSVPRLDETAPVVPQAGAGKLALTAAGAFGLNKEFTVMAYVKNPQVGWNVVLRLPEGLVLADNRDSAEKPVRPEPGRDYTQVSWKVKSTSIGLKIIEADLKASTGNLATAKYDVKIRDKGFFDVN